jgi:signal transduction histidine kinase
MSVLFFCLAWAIDAILIAETPAEADWVRVLHLPSVYRWAVLMLAALALLMLLARSEQTFRGLVGIQLSAALAVLVFYRLPVEGVLLLLLSGLLPLVVYEPFAVNVCLCGGYLVVIVGACGLTGGYNALMLGQLAVAGILFALTGSLMGRYWERVVSLEAQVTRQEDNVAALARANSLSQDYAREIEEESRVAERLSLTRDIHDAVGYTLTNTIMAMEAVKVMVKSEPERVERYLEVTRRNAEEGLAAIKRMLRDFRSRERSVDSCVIAIKKLVKVFTLSTGLSVRYEFGNLDVAVLDLFSECVYHFIQEGLINAFRHGRARNVALLFWDYGGSLRVTMDDDGSGCGPEIVPGIGLTGMAERAKPYGGRVQIERNSGGFRISLYLAKADEVVGR